MADAASFRAAGVVGDDDDGRSPTPPQTPHSPPSTLPMSVRGAPPELRRAIRKRQNSESARRCRERKRAEARRAANATATHASRIDALERSVAALSARTADVADLVADLSARSAIAAPYTAFAGGRVALPFAPAPAAPPAPPAPAPHIAGGVPLAARSSALFLPSAQPSVPQPGISISPAQAARALENRRHVHWNVAASHGVVEHTRQLRMALGNGPSEHATALAMKVDELESTWWP